MEGRGKPDISGWVVCDVQDGAFDDFYVKIYSKLYPTRADAVKSWPGATVAYVEIYLREKPELVEMNENDVWEVR